MKFIFQCDLSLLAIDRQLTFYAFCFHQIISNGSPCICINLSKALLIMHTSRRNIKQKKTYRHTNLPYIVCKIVLILLQAIFITIRSISCQINKLMVFYGHFRKKRTTMKKQTTPKIITDLKQYLTPCNKFLYRNTIMSIWRLVLNCKCACARARTIVRMHCTHTHKHIIHHMQIH